LIYQCGRDVSLTKRKIRGRETVTKAVIAFVLAFLTLIPWIGYVSGIASIILSIDFLVELRDRKDKKGKALAILALIITASIVLFKVFLLLGGLFHSVEEFSRLSYEDAILKCEQQKESFQETCYMGLLMLHSNDSRVTSGETCLNIAQNKIQVFCYSFVASLTNDTKMCERIEVENGLQETNDARNYCFAAVTKDMTWCGHILDPASKLKCVSDIEKNKR